MRTGRTATLGQNFLRNRRTARRLVHLAGGADTALRIDLGAGKGAITEVAAATFSGRIVAIEKDPRLVEELVRRFSDWTNVEVRGEDLLDVPLPSEPFVCLGNPPFNLSTAIVRRWMTSGLFQSGALIVEREFGRRVAGEFGTTKLSASLDAHLELTLGAPVHAEEFHPQPRVRVAILRAASREHPLVAVGDRVAYWLFVNYLFERGRYTIGEAIGDLGLRRTPPATSATPLRSASTSALVDLFAEVRRGARQWAQVEAFERGLPVNRRALASPAG
ncbi:MAG TPA: rRNA adenine N-6-methyltransferase family protein [Candidatus Dormibacteraeota bacterium]